MGKVNASQAAGIVGVSERTIRDWLKKGALKGDRTGREYEIDTRDIYRMLESRNRRRSPAIIPEDIPTISGVTNDQIYDLLRRIERLLTDRWEIQRGPLEIGIQADGAAPALLRQRRVPAVITPEEIPEAVTPIIARIREEIQTVPLKPSRKLSASQKPGYNRGMQILKLTRGAYAAEVFPNERDVPRDYVNATEFAERHGAVRATLIRHMETGALPHAEADRGYSDERKMCFVSPQDHLRIAEIYLGDNPSAERMLKFHTCPICKHLEERPHELRKSPPRDEEGRGADGD